MPKIDITKSWQITKDGSLGVIIPKIIREELKIKAGTRFLVSYDKEKRLIFQRID